MTAKSIMRWLPATLLLALFGLLWATAVAGGERGVLAWLLLMGGLPYLGIVVLFSVIGVLIWNRKFTLSLIITLIVSLLVIWPFLWRFGVWPMAYPISMATTSPTANVRLPANEPLLVAWGGDTPYVNYHVTFPDARWAYDLMVEPAFIGSEHLEDYGCWGVPVVAPTKGEIVVAHDGEADVAVGQERAEGATHKGNHIYMRIAGGTFITIGHLQQNSIVVSEGDIVQEGEILGKCGNSGSSDEPHIHIHHQRQDPRTIPLGMMAEGLPLTFRDHDGPLRLQGGLDEIDGKIMPHGPIIQHKNEGKK